MSKAYFTEAVTYLRLMLSLFVDTVLRLFPFVARLHARDNCTDLDFLQWCGKVDVERKRVRWVDVASRWMLLENLVLRASERL